MRTAWRRSLLAIAIPVIVFLGLGTMMMNLTGRDQFPQTADPASVPLNFRVTGYDAQTASEYWAWLGAAGRQAERRFLLTDLAFPLAYGASLVAGLFIAWNGAGRPISKGAIIAPVAITILTDWTENIVHLSQLGHFEAGLPVDPGWMLVASIATSTKM